MIEKMKADRLSSLTVMAMTDRRLRGQYNSAEDNFSNAGVSCSLLPFSFMFRVFIQRCLACLYSLNRYGKGTFTASK